MLDWRRRGPLCWMMAFFTASYQKLPWTPTHQSPKAPFGLMWLSLPHLVYNSVRSLTATLTSVLTKLYNSSTPTQSPTRSLGGMIDRHPAEITVMQFTGHSLPVHQSMSVPWEFFFTSSYFISQFPPTQFPLITTIRMHHSEWHFWLGRRSKYNIFTCN